jgi:hypothetical protein
MISFRAYRIEEGGTTTPHIWELGEASPNLATVDIICWYGVLMQ